MTRYRIIGPRQTMLWRVFFAMGVLATVNCRCDDKVRGMVEDSRTPPVAADSAIREAFEKEPNDAPETATPLKLGNELRPLPCELSTASDVDWFELTSGVADEELVELRIVPDGPLNLSLHVLAGPGALASTYDVAGSGEAESVAVLRIGKKPLLFAVRAIGGLGGAYHVEISRRIGQGLEAEPNDDPLNAGVVLVPGDIQGLIDRPDDRDVFRLPASDRVRQLRIEFEPVQGITQVFRVFDGVRFETPLLAMQFGGAAGERGVVPAFQVEAGAEPYFVVTTTGGFDRRAPYLLRLSELEDVSASVEVEPNDTQPRPIAVPGVLQGSFFAAEDVDRFVLGALVDPVQPGSGTLDAGRAPSVVHSGSDPGQDAGGKDAGWDGAVANDGADVYSFASKVRNGAPLNVRVELLRPENVVGLSINNAAGVRNAVLDAKTPVFEFCEPTYRPAEVELTVRPVQLVASGKGFDYRVDSSLASGPDFELEPNDAIQNADELVASRTGTTARDGDVDVYGFRVTPDTGGGSRSVTLKVDGTQPVALELVDQFDALVSSVETRVGPEIDVELPAGVYFLKVKGSVASCQPYKVLARF